MHYDVVILTSEVDEEKKAIVEVFGLEEVREDNPVTPIRWEGVIGNLSVAYTYTGKGIAGTTDFVKEVIRHWKPSYIIFVGIGGGVRGRVELGDVVFSDDVHLYEREHVEDGSVEPRETTIEPPSPFLKIIAHAVKDFVKFDFDIYSGKIISTGKVINDPNHELLRKILDFYGKQILVFETEGGGVGKAIYSEKIKKDEKKLPEYIVIRGISDFVDDPKGKKVRDKEKRNAARNAAKFAYELVKKLASGKSSELKRYLEHVKSYFTEKSEIDGKSLKDYYVHPVMKVYDIEGWNKPEEELSHKKLLLSLQPLPELLIKLIKEIEKYIIEDWDVKKFLEGDELYTIIGAPFGAGKTSYLKYLAYTLAEEGEYIPVYIQLRGCKSIYDADVYKGRDLSYVLEIAPKSRIVLLVDSLDEFLGDPREVIREIRKLKVKAIIATRLKAGYPEELRIDKYVRIFGFRRKQIEEFFNKYGVDISFRDIEELDLEDTLRKPLFCWMLAMAWNTLKNVKLRKEWSGELRRALLYYIFTREIVKGKYRKVREVREFIPYYEWEKEFLRIVAALANIYEELGKPLKYDDIVRGVKEINPELGGLVERGKEFGDPVLTSYFLILPGIRGRIVEFIHRSFKEYFLAEYYFKNIRDGRKELMYAGMPSEETIDFLKGLAEISRNEEVLRLLEGLWGEDFKDVILNFFDYEKIRKNAKSFVESDDLVLFADKINGIGKFKVIRAVNPARGWLYRWISLCVLDWKDKRSIEKEKIVKLIKETIRTVPFHLRQLDGVDLSGVDLSKINFRCANLSHANLTKAYLINADLDGANLTEACLSEANLAGAELTEANLSHANLAKADLTRANLFGANLTEANLREAYLRKAYLVTADLMGADLTKADLTEATISGIDLRMAYFIEVKAHKVYFYHRGKPITEGIVLGSKEEEVSRTLKKIDPELREVILRDNPDLRKYWEE